MKAAWRLAACGLMVGVCLVHASDSNARSKRRSKRGRVVAPFSLTAADGTGLRLVALTANVVVDGPLAFTELRLKFHNPQNRQREGRFAITLPPSAAISRLAMKIDGQWQEGEIVERQKARVVYESYLHVQRDPALLEKDAGNTFRARIFPIEARSNKELRISYSEELVSSRRPYRLRLRGLPRIGRLRIRALVHRRTARGLSWRTRRFSRYRHRPRRDFTLALPAGISGLRHKDLAVVRLAPRVPARWQAMGSLLVLFDTSASRALDFAQDVARFGQVVETLARRHGRRMRLQVTCFDQSVKPVYVGPAGGFNARHLRRIRQRGALGASNLEAALSWAARQRGFQRLLLVTDGVATAGGKGARLRKVLRGAPAHLRRVDVLTVGYDQDSDLEKLVTGVLPAPGIVMDNDPTPVRIAERLGQTVRTRVKVSVEGATWVWPRHLDSLQPGSEALVYVELPRPKGPGARTVTVQLTGLVKQRLSVQLHTTQRPLLERAWVRSRIAWLSALDGSTPVRKRIVRLSQQHRVLSEHTALLVLENDAEYRAHGLRRSALSDILTVGQRGLMLQSRTRSKRRRSPRRKLGSKGRGIPAKQRHVGQDDFWDLALPRYGKYVAPSVEQLRRNAARRRLSSVRRPTVFVTRASVSGGLDRSTLRWQIRRHNLEIRHCYQTELQMHPLLEGVVTLAFTIRRDGRVGTAVIASSTLHSRAVESCILRRARTWRFSGEDPSSMPYVTYPYRFTNRALARQRARRGLRRVSVAPQRKVGLKQASQRKVGLKQAYRGELLRFKRLLRSNKHQQALALARRWRLRSPKSLLALVALGEALQALGRRRAATRVYGSIIDLHPSRAELRRYAGNRLAALGDVGLPLALDTYAKAVAQRPDHAHGYRLLAYAQARLGRLHRALGTLERGLRRRYPAGRFAGVKRVLRADLGLLARALLKRFPKQRAALRKRLARSRAKLAAGPSTRVVLTWETDANDIDLKVGTDGLVSGGKLYKDVTNGFGPECVVLPRARRSAAWPLRVIYDAQGPMGYGLGTVSVLRHDGRGGLRFDERPFVIMKNGGTVSLGKL